MITFDVAGARSRLEVLRKDANAPGFWDDGDHARKAMSELSRLESEVTRYDRIMSHISEIDEMNRLGIEEQDDSFASEIEGALEHIAKELKEIETASLLEGEFDTFDAIMSLHPGAGGLESQDWAEMLMRMYLR